MPRRVELITYRQVADRIEEHLGIRPAASTLRAAAATANRSTARSRLTAEMPPPAVPPRPGVPTQYDAAAIDRWLARHPLTRARAAQDRLAATPPSRRDAAVARARSAGLSWQQIADAINTADGSTHSKQWAQQRYGDTPGS